MQAEKDNIDSGKYDGFLLNRIWVIYKISNEANFITSDNPVILQNYKNGLNYYNGGGGLANSDVDIILPLSSKLLLILYSSNIVKRIENKIILVDDVNFINRINELQRKNCLTHIFYKK